MNKYPLSGLGTTLPSWLSFSRGVATKNPNGTAVGANAVRINTQRTLMGTWGAAQSVYAPTSALSVSVIAAGRDQAGTVPLLFCTSYSNNGVQVCTLVGEPPVAITAATYTLDSDPGLNDTRAVDLVNPGTQTPFAANLAFEPLSGVICFGTIVAVCQVKQKVLGEWIVAGTGIAYSLNQGVTWLRYFNDTTNAKQVRKSRINFWSCENWYCPLWNSDDPPDEVIIPIADYRFAPGPGDSDLPAGGRFFWFKLKRDGAGVYQPLFINSQPVVAQYTLDANVYGAASPPAYQHFHSAGITRHGEDKYAVVGAVGDQYCSSNIRIIVNDVSDSGFANPANWSVKVNSYGTIDSAMTDATLNNGFGGPTNPPPAAVNANSNSGDQFVGVAPGPEKDSLLVGGDAGSDGGHVLRYPSTTLADPPTHEIVLSSVNYEISRPLYFSARTDEPHKKVRTVVMSRVSDRRFKFDQPGGLDTFGLSYSSGEAGSWCDVPMRDYVGSTTVGYSENVFVIKDYIYLIEQTAQGSTRVVRRKLPARVQGQPLLIGPGGAQWLVDNPETANVGSGVQACVQSSGQWLTRNMNGTNGAALSPQPPTMTKAVYRMTALRSGTRNLLSVFPAVPAGNNPTQKMSASQPYTNIYSMRTWMLANSAKATDSPQRAAGRSASAAAFDIGWFGGNIDRYLGFVQGYYTHTTESWVCLTAFSNLGHLQGIAEAWYLTAFAQGVPADVDFYLAIGEACEGPGFFGYPLPPNVQSSGPTTYPPEQSEIGGLSLSGSWTVLAGGITPNDSWDQYVPECGTTLPVFPLLTISDASGNTTITVSASPFINPFASKASSLRVTIRKGGTTSTFETKDATFMRGRPFLSAVVYNSTAQTLTLYAVVNGQRIPALTISISLQSTTFTKIRLGDHQSGGSIQVSSFQWFGFATDTSAYSASQVATQFETLAFLQ